MVNLILIAALSVGAAKAKPKAPPAKPVAAKAVAAKPVAPKKDEPKPVEAAPTPAATRELVQRESKIEFDDRLVQGQRAQGAVYLFQRGELKFSTLVKKPASFKDRTLTSVYGAEEKGE